MRNYLISKKSYLTPDLGDDLVMQSEKIVNGKILMKNQLYYNEAFIPAE